MENQEQPPVQQQPPTQVVKLEIGKVLGVIIAVVIVAVVAGMFLQSSYFQGSLTADEITQICAESPEDELCSSTQNATAGTDVSGATTVTDVSDTSTLTLTSDAIMGIDLILAGNVDDGLTILEQNSDIDIELTSDLLNIDEEAAIAALESLKDTSDFVAYDNDLQNAIDKTLVIVDEKDAIIESVAIDLKEAAIETDNIAIDIEKDPYGIVALDAAIDTFVTTNTVAINTSLINDLTNEMAIYDKTFDAVAGDILANDIEMVTKYADLDIKTAIQDYSVTKDIAILESDIVVIKTDVLREAGMSLLDSDISIAASDFDKVVHDFDFDGGFDFTACLVKTDSDTLAKMIDGDFIAGIEKNMGDAVMTLGKNLECPIIK